MRKETLIEEYKRLLARLRAGKLRKIFRPDEAEDALHDAFSILWSRPPGSKPPHSLSWEFRYRMEREEKARKSQQRLELMEDMWVTPPPDDMAENFRIVERIIERELSPLQREILERREYEQQTVQEIAAALGMKEAAVRMNLSRARKTIREIYNRTEQ